MALIHNGTGLIGETEVRKLLADVLKPIKVKQVTVTRSDNYCVQGVVLAYCPVEKRELGKDFDVELSGNGTSVAKVIVDGRVLYPKIVRAHGGAPPNKP